MSDIRKRVGKKGTTYQVRYPSKTTKSGYAFKSFSTRKEALAFREDAAARDRSRPFSQNQKTVAQAVQKWLDVCEKEGRNGRDPVTRHTLKGYKNRGEIIKSFDWQGGLHELSAPDVVEFRSWLLNNYSRDQARKVLSSFHSIVLEMVGRGFLVHDIVAGVSISGSSRYDEPVTIPTIEDIQKLLSAADRLANSKNKRIQKTWERYRPMLYLAADTGMRPQEYIVAQRSKLKNGGIGVERALEPGAYKLSVTKTRAGRRFIELSPSTYDMVRHYADKLAPKNKHDLVFPTATGHWQNADNWRKRGFYAVCSEAGLIRTVVDKNGEPIEKPKYKPYDLRHFYASMLIEQRCNLKRMQKLMGHEDIQTTLNVYGHVIEKSESDGQTHTGLLENLGR